MSISRKKDKGFVILYAVIITTVVLIVGVSLMNIMTKQLVLSSISRNAKVSYYAALSGRACADFWAQVGPEYFGGYDLLNVWQEPSVTQITCNGKPVELTPGTRFGEITFYFNMSIGGQTVSSDVNVVPIIPDTCDYKQLIITSAGYNDTRWNAINNPPPRLVRSLYKDKEVIGPSCRFSGF